MWPASSVSGDTPPSSSSVTGANLLTMLVSFACVIVIVYNFYQLSFGNGLDFQECVNRIVCFGDVWHLQTLSVVTDTIWRCMRKRGGGIVDVNFEACDSCSSAVHSVCEV